MAYRSEQGICGCARIKKASEAAPCLAGSEYKKAVGAEAGDFWGGVLLAARRGSGIAVGGQMQKQRPRCEGAEQRARMG